MANFLSVDGKFYRFGTVLADMLLLGFLWTLFSLPIITIGATTTALYYVCTKKASGKDEYILSGFFKSFKANFVKATMIFLILALISYIVWLNLQILGEIDMGWLRRPVTIALYFMLAQVIFVVTHVFCILARFETSVFNALKSALFMSYRHLMTTVTNLVLWLMIAFVSFSFPVLILFMMGIFVYLSSYLFVTIFRKHYPDFDGTKVATELES